MAWNMGRKEHRIEIADSWGKAARRARGLSGRWRAEADRAWRKAAHAEGKAEQALQGWYARLRPKVIHMEHRFGDVAIAIGERAKKAT